jgi:rhodanese-related sulfurtransferase
MLRAHLIYGTAAAILAVACGQPAQWAFVGDGGCKSDAESLLVRKTGSIDECYNLCSTTSGCVGFEYFTKKALAGRCHLQSELALQSTEKGGKFGVQCYNMVLSTSPTPKDTSTPATTLETPEERVSCGGDRYTFDAGYGGCETYSPNYTQGDISNHESCESDFNPFWQPMFRAYDVCEECGHCVPPPPRSFDAFRLVGDGRLRDAAQKGFATAATIKTMSKIKTFEACGQGCVLHNEHCSAYPNAPTCMSERRRCNGFEYTPSKRKCLLKGGLFGAATINAGNEKVQSYVLKTCGDSGVRTFDHGITTETLVSQNCTFVTNAGEQHHVADCRTSAESCSPPPPPATCHPMELYSAINTIEGGEMPCGAVFQAGVALEEGESSMGIDACDCYNLIPSDHPGLVLDSVVDCLFSPSDHQTVLQSILFCHAVQDADDDVHGECSSGCDGGSFCNNDDGPEEGFCESCDNHANVCECFSDGLPELGALACAETCYAGDDFGSCERSGEYDDDDDDCAACHVELASCFASASCAEIMHRLESDSLHGGHAIPSEEDWMNEEFSAMLMCHFTNCDHDEDDSNGDECDACHAESIACSLNAACSEIGDRTAGGAAPSAEDMQNEAWSAVMVCYIEECTGDDDGDGNECPECSAATTACFLDADCGPILLSIGVEERYPNGEELKNELISTLMTCHIENCGGGDDDDDDDVLGCLSAECPAVFDTCMGGDCAAELGAALESDTGPPTPEFVAAQSADFQALYKCYLAECENVDDDKSTTTVTCGSGEGEHTESACAHCDAHEEGDDRCNSADCKWNSVGPRCEPRSYTESSTTTTSTTSEAPEESWPCGQTQNQAIVIDIRAIEDFAEGHVACAVNLQLSAEFATDVSNYVPMFGNIVDDDADDNLGNQRLGGSGVDDDADDDDARRDARRKDAAIGVHCYTGQLAIAAVVALRDAGFTNVVNLGGYTTDRDAIEEACNHCDESNMGPGRRTRRTSKLKGPFFCNGIMDDTDFCVDTTMCAAQDEQSAALVKSFCPGMCSNCPPAARSSTE